MLYGYLYIFNGEHAFHFEQIFHGVGGGGSTCLRLKPGWVMGSGQGPQWGTWPLTSGRRTAKTRTIDPVMVDGDI